MSVLCLTLKKKWYDAIVHGDKREEYREIKDYWTRRLLGAVIKQLNPKQVVEFFQHSILQQDPFQIWKRQYTEVEFRDGYGKDARKARFYWHGLEVGTPKKGWCEQGDEEKTVYIIKYGERIPV